MSNPNPTVSKSGSPVVFNYTYLRNLLTSETSRQTSLLFTAQLSSTLLNTILFAVIARSLGKTNYGLFAFCWISVIQFLNYFFEFGVFAAGARLLALEHAKIDTQRLIGGLLILAVSIGLVFDLIIVGVAEIFGPSLNLISNYIKIDASLFLNVEVRHALLLSAPLAAFLPIQFCLEQICQGLNRIGALALLRVILPSVTVLIIIALSALQQINVITALLASLGGLAIACSTIIILLKPSIKGTSQSIQQILKETQRFGLDIYFGRITTMISTKLDSLLIPLFLGTTTFGFYNLAQRFAEPLTNLSRSMAITRFKTFANEPSVKRSIIQFNFLFLSAGALALMLIGPYALILIYSSEYAYTTKLLPAFAVAAFFGGLFQPYNGFLSAHGRGGELRNISVVIGILNVVSFLFVLPRFGVMGAAWMVASASALNFSLHYYYYRTVYYEQIGQRPRRVTMIDLSNDPQPGIAWLKEQFGQYELELINKADVRTGSQLQRLQQMRQKERDSFVIFCDRLEWQTRRTPMLIFGLLSGSEECWLVDSHGNFARSSRWQVIFINIPHLFVETIGAFLVIATSWFVTKLLEITRDNSLTTWQPKAGQPHIVFIRTTPTSGAQTGGSNSHITGFTKGAVANGATLKFISNDAISGINKEQTPIEVIAPSSFFNAHRMIFELWNNLVFTFKALGKVREEQPHFIYQRYSRFSWAGVAISRLTKIPLILEYNGSEVWIGRNWDDVPSKFLWLLERFEKLNLAASQLIFVVSEVEKNNLIKAQVSAAKIFVNPNGVDPEMFKPDQGGQQVREELNIADKTVIGFVGTFGPWHGVLALAEAIGQIPASAQCHFLLIGEGSLKPNVEQIIKSHNCMDRVTFTGRLSHKHVPAYLDACDILVSPHVPMDDGSEFFGSPTKLFEYMAMSKAIVASRLGQIADVIQDQVNGCLLEPGNIEQLATTITKLAQSPTERTRLGEQARLDAMAKYTWQRNAGRVIEAYQNPPSF